MAAGRRHGMTTLSGYVTVDKRTRGCLALFSKRGSGNPSRDPGQPPTLTSSIANVSGWPASGWLASSVIVSSLTAVTTKC